MTSEEEEGPVVASSSATPSTATVPRVTAAIPRVDSDHGVTSSSSSRAPSYGGPRPNKTQETQEEIEEDVIQEMDEQEVETGAVDCDVEEEDSSDDESSDTSVLVVPYPELVPVVFFCLKQTTCPRSWCIRMVSTPYPLKHKVDTRFWKHGVLGSESK